MSINTLSRLTPQNIIALIENEKDEAVNLMQNDQFFVSRVDIYDFTKSPYPDDEERQYYEEILTDNPNYSPQIVGAQQYIINGHRNRLIDQLFIDVMNKTIDNGKYDNIENGLSDYAKYILYVDNMMHINGQPAILKEAIINAFIRRADMFIRQGQSVYSEDNHYDVYVQLPDEVNCIGTDPISMKKITTGFRLDADDRRVCYDISTIISIVNSTFGINTPVSPFTRKPFSENDMRRIRGFIKSMSSTRPITRTMTRRENKGGKHVKSKKHHKKRKYKTMRNRRRI